MDLAELASALGLGIIEGLTEFLPVSSTAHLILAGDLIGFRDNGKTFEVMIQLGAILAVLVVYFQRIIHLLVTLKSDPASRRFVAGVLLAFLPAALIGALAHDFIKTFLFQSPRLISLSLIVGGVALLIVDRLKLKPKYDSVTAYSMPVYLGIGLFQCLAMVPGVSRAGATIAGALLLGSDRKAAAEFSFWLAMPTMAGAFALDLYQNRNGFDAHQSLLIAIGFIAAFLTAILVVRSLIGFIARNGFLPFAIWRILVGAIALAMLGNGWLQ